MPPPATTAGASATDWRWQAGLLAGLTVAVFSTTLSADFVYDARLQILTDPFIHDPGNWPHVLLFRVLSMDVLDFNRPVHLASLMLDAAVWGRAPFGYHLTSVLLHAANVVLLWGVMRALPLPANGPSSAASPWLGRLASLLPPLLFAVHPVVTEAVCEPTFREDLLVGLFTLAALLLAMRHDPRAEGWDGRRALACAACCLLAIASKESGIVASLLLGAYWLLFRRGEPGGFWMVAIGAAKLLVVGFLVARFLLEPSPSRIFESRPEYPGGSLAAALAIEPRILALYAQLVVLPVNLCADYGLHSVRHLPLPAAILMLAVLLAAAVAAIRSDRRMGLAVALILLPLLPVANLVPIYRAAADRYLYVPMAGVALAVAVLLDAPWLAARIRLRHRLTAALLAVVAVLALGCIERQRVWTSPLALWEDAYRKNPAAYTPTYGLGEALRDVGRFPEAERALREAIRITGGRRGDAWATLALVLDAQGRTAEADEAIREAIAVDPKLADPDARVAVIAMDREMAEALKPLLARQPRP
jgi:tetratricopeptide (TPR) repeat protein